MLTKTPSLTSLIICIIFIVQANINGQISSGITTNKATVDLTKIKQEEAPAIKSSEIKIDFGQDRHFESAEGFVFTANGMKVSPSQRSATLISKPIEIPIQTPEPFLSVGCVWTVENIDQENMSLAIRGSSDGKAWGEWLKVTKDDDLSSSPNESFGHLIFLDQKTSYLQYRISLQQRNSALSPNLKRLRLACISPGKTPAAAIETIRKQHEVEAQHKTLGLSSFPMPSVTSRTTWGCPDGQSSPAWSPQYTSVSHLIIHHTDNPNTLTDWAAVVKSIWQFHTVTRGWGDIGYNYLVDPNGVIYEGRAGGDNVIGAHFSCANTNTMGVAALGTFTTVSPASNALTSIKNLLAWKSDQLGINPLGTAYHNLTQLSLYNISGHRDSNPTAAPGTCPTATVCPGDNLYSQLPNIRAAVKDLLTPIVNVTFTTVPAGLQILVDGIFYTTPKTFNWQSGAVHVATASSPQSGPAGTQYVYSSWSDGQPQTRLITTPLESNTTFTANYTTQHYLTMAAGTGGGISPPSNWYNNGQNVQIEATPNDNYNFANWTGSGTGSYTGTNNPATVTMNGPITQTASFAPIATTRTLTVASSSPSSGINIIVSPNDNNGQGNGTTQFSRTYDKDKTVTLIAPSAAGGNNFQKWSRNGVDWSTNQTTNVNIDANYTMTAVFMPPPAEPFTDISASLTGAYYGSVAWGDYDNDGDLDILMTGNTNSNQRISKVYRNNGGNFVEISTSFVGIYLGTAVWGDYDNDGDLDVLLTGNTTANTRVTRVYRNDGGTFVDISAPLIAVNFSSAAWGDYDNDGDLDILLTGYDGVTAISKIYRNDGGSFVDIFAFLIGVLEGSVGWGDYDNDGDLDILLTGTVDTNTSTLIARVYRNDGGNFIDISAPFVGVYLSSTDWGDYDNDGDLDIVLTGGTGGLNMSKIYRNDSGSFVDISASLTAVSAGSVAWGDYDNDGDLDLLLSGYINISNFISKLYRNDNGNFVEVYAPFAEVVYSSVAWGDYDNDGDLDILLTGTIGGLNGVSKIYRNNIGAANTIPIAPTNLASFIIGNSVALNWNKSTDSQTAQNALTYNLSLGTTIAGVQKVSPMANVATGKRKIPKLGNTNHQNSWTIKNLSPGTYYWSVQAIDNAFAGSAFASEQSFTISAKKDYALIADKIINFDRFTKVEGEVFSNRDVAFLAGKPSIIQGNLTAFRNVVVANANTIEGNLAAGGTITLDPNATITGSVVPDVEIDKIFLPTFTWGPFGGPEIAIAAVDSAYLAPGDYKLMRAYAGAIMKLSSGTYNVNRFVLDASSKLKLDLSGGPIEINVVSRLLFRPSTKIIITSAIGSSEDISINYKGIDKVEISKDTELQGTLTAPDARVKLGSRASFLGSICANRVDVYYSSHVRHHSIPGGIPKMTTPTHEDDVTDEQSAVVSYELTQNYPNPFNPSTMIGFVLPEAGEVTLKIYNTAGQLVKQVASGEFAAGQHQVNWDGRNVTGEQVAAGIYLYQLVVRDAAGAVTFTETKRMALLK